MHIQSQHHVLIAGSRYATRDMLDYARRAVQRAHAKGYVVLVGDNPKGVDMAVVQECRRLKAKVIVAGIANFPRNYGCKHGCYVKVTRDLYRSAGGDLLNGYTARDRWMVDQCTTLHCSSGTATVPARKRVTTTRYSAAKKAHLVNFDRSPQL